MSADGSNLVVPGPGPAPVNSSGPDFEARPRLSLQSLPVPPELRAMFPPGVYLAVYRLGQCDIVVTRARPAAGRRARYRLTVSHRDRHPTWDELAEARYRILGAVPWMAIYLPPKDDYVNKHRNVFHMVECDDPWVGGPERW